MDFTVPKEADGITVYQFLKAVAGCSTRIVRSVKFREDGLARNGVRARTSELVHTGDVVTIRLPVDKSTLEPVDMPLDILHEDADLLVINKPAGLAMHPTHNHQGDTLVNGVTAYLRRHGRGADVHPVGRLDKNTSGVVVCACNRYAASRLNGRVEKEYLAVVQGDYCGSGVINRPILRPDPMKTLRAVGEGGAPSVTHWEAVRSGSGLTLVKIRLETGRTHQIRVHFASMGTPLAGDDMYGGTREHIARHALHCQSAWFVHPVTGKVMRFTAPLPADMDALTKNLELLA